MILIIDPISVATDDLKTLPSKHAADVFLRAIRPIGRELPYSPEGTWERYRSGQLPAAQMRLIAPALEEYLALLPEFARITLIGLAHNGGATLTGKVLTAKDETEERAVLDGFWQIAAKAARKEYTIVSFGGLSFGGPFLLRRSRLAGLATSLSIPLNRYRPDAHFDLAGVLSNWNRAQEFPLELWAERYGIAGPWDLNTATAIRAYMGAGEAAEATALAQARLEAIHHLYERLAPAYTG